MLARICARGSSRSCIRGSGRVAAIARDYRAAASARIGFGAPRRAFWQEVGRAPAEAILAATRRRRRMIEALLARRRRRAAARPRDLGRRGSRRSGAADVEGGARVKIRDVILYGPSRRDGVLDHGGGNPGRLGRQAKACIQVAGESMR